MSFNPQRMNIAGTGGRQVLPGPPPEPLRTECCGATMTPQQVVHHGSLYDEAMCDDCGGLVCHDCGGPLDSDAEAVE